MEKVYKVLSIAGSDPSGGAGIQADIKAITSLGGYAATAITALTVQNTFGVRSVFAVPPQVVAEQIGAVMEDIRPQAVKIGMVKDSEIVGVIVDAIRKYSPQVVVYDPVMVATSGDRLVDNEALQIIENELIPLSTLITPNLREAEVLLGRRIADWNRGKDLCAEVSYNESVEQMVSGAIELSDKYGTGVLIKGGHLEGEQMCDVLCAASHLDLSHRLSHFVEKRILTSNLHGTGCTLSSAIATLCAKGVVEGSYDLVKAIAQAKQYVTRAIDAGSHKDIGQGNGPLWHLVQ